MILSILNSKLLFAGIRIRKNFPAEKAVADVGDAKDSATGKTGRAGRSGQ